MNKISGISGFIQKIKFVSLESQKEWKKRTGLKKVLDNGCNLLRLGKGHKSKRLKTEENKIILKKSMQRYINIKLLKTIYIERKQSEK